MPVVPAKVPGSLIQRPSQDMLSQTYGGGSFQQPPVLNANIVPNATGLVDTPGETPEPLPSAAAPATVTSSPLAQRQKDKGGQAGEPHSKAEGSIVDTEGQFDLEEFGVGAIASAALPGGSFTSTFGKVMQALFGTTAVVGMEDVGIGHPQWDQKMQMKSNAQMVNDNKDLRSSRTANTNRSQPRNTAPGRRGARDRGSPDAGGGSYTDKARAASSAQSDMASERGRQTGVGDRGGERGGIGGGGGHGVDSSGRHDEL